MLLVMVKYRDDAERKRVEYLIDKYRGSVSVSRPQGAVLLIDGDRDSLEGFLQELAAKLGPESIEVYKLQPSSLLPEPGHRRITLDTSMSCDEVSGAIAFLMARLRGVLRSSIGGVREYAIRGRWGWARARLALAPMPGGGGCRATIEVEAYEPALSRVAETLARDLSVMGRVTED